MLTMALLFGAGLLAAAMNSLAGGGSFVALPAMIAAGLPSVAANASSTISLWPGGAASAWTYHTGLRPICGVPPWPMLGLTLVGGLVGSILLLWTPSSAFDVVLPWLLLLATLMLAFGRRLGLALQGRFSSLAPLVMLVQFLLGIYGGYFGGAVGLMMMAAWSLFGETDFRQLNGPRTLMVTVANSVAVVIFILAGAARWWAVLPMLCGSLIGGWAGARLGRRLPSEVVRVLTLCATAAITLVFFVRAYR